jgi:hypothetical protein
VSYDGLVEDFSCFHNAVVFMVNNSDFSKIAAKIALESAELRQSKELFCI